MPDYLLFLGSRKVVSQQCKEVCNDKMCIIIIICCNHMCCLLVIWNFYVKLQNKYILPQIFLLFKQCNLVPSFTTTTFSKKVNVTKQIEMRGYTQFMCKFVHIGQQTGLNICPKLHLPQCTLTLQESSARISLITYTNSSQFDKNSRAI